MAYGGSTQQVNPNFKQRWATFSWEQGSLSDAELKRQTVCEAEREDRPGGGACTSTIGRGAWGKITPGYATSLQDPAFSTASKAVCAVILNTVGSLAALVIASVGFGRAFVRCIALARGSFSIAAAQPSPAIILGPKLQAILSRAAEGCSTNSRCGLAPVPVRGLASLPRHAHSTFRPVDLSAAPSICHAPPSPPRPLPATCGLLLPNFCTSFRHRTVSSPSPAPISCIRALSEVLPFTCISTHKCFSDTSQLVSHTDTHSTWYSLYPIPT